MNDFIKELKKAKQERCKAICESLKVIDAACEEIQNAGGCSECPMRENGLCIGTSEIFELAALGNAFLWEKFLDFADDVNGCIHPELDGVDSDYDNYRDKQFEAEQEEMGY